MKRLSLICALGLLFGASSAGADDNNFQRGSVPTADVQGCVQADRNNSASIKQNSDVNMAACIQAGRNNDVTIEQSGSNNTARAIQAQTPNDRRGR